MYEGDDDVETGVEERGPSDLIDLICRDCTSVAGGSSRHFFDKLNKIAKNLKIFMEIDLIKYYHLIFFS